MKRKILKKPVKKRAVKQCKKSVPEVITVPLREPKQIILPQEEAHGQKCLECGHINDSGVEYCEKCGGKLSAQEQPRNYNADGTEAQEKVIHKDTKLILGEILKETFDIFFKMTWVFIIFASLEAAYTLLLPDVRDISSFKAYYVVIYLASWLLSLFGNFIIFYISHKIYYGDKYDLNGLLYGMEKKFPFFVLNSIILGVIIGIGSLVIIPGIILSLMYAFVPYTTAVKDNVPSHFELSDKVTQGNKMDMLIFYLVMVVIYLPFLGACYGIQLLLQKALDEKTALLIYSFLITMLTNIAHPMIVVIYDKLEGNKIEKQYMKLTD